jgi:NADH:ubiquinone oxidoreductase subunit F (NADH-binding)
VGGAVGRPGVYEIGLGLPASELIDLAGGPSQPLQAILAGGYFGGWVPLPAAAAVPVSPPGLRLAGASFGAGVLIALPAACCGLAETARVLRYLAGQSAGQCGPCTFGLPAIADALAHLAWRGRDERAAEWLQSLLPLVDQRGACHFPDGAVALVASALRVFAGDLQRHLSQGPCPGASHPAVLPVPRPPGRP